MPTCLDIITDALKLSRVISSGEEPDTDEAADGMVALQSMYDQFRTNGMFGGLEDVYAVANDTAEEGKRYYLTAGVTLTAASNEYTDGCGTTRQPRDLALYEVLTSTGTHTAKLYDRVGWVDLLGLTLTAQAPLAQRNRMGLAACLAINGAFAPLFGDTATLNPDVRALANAFLASLASKSGSSQDSAGAEYY